MTKKLFFTIAFVVFGGLFFFSCSNESSSDNSMLGIMMAGKSSSGIVQQTSATSEVTINSATSTIEAYSKNNTRVALEEGVIKITKNALSSVSDPLWNSDAFIVLPDFYKANKNYSITFKAKADNAMTVYMGAIPSIKGGTEEINYTADCNANVFSFSEDYQTFTIFTNKWPMDSSFFRIYLGLGFYKENNAIYLKDFKIEEYTSSINYDPNDICIACYSPGDEANYKGMSWLITNEGHYVFSSTKAVPNTATWCNEFKLIYPYKVYKNKAYRITFKIKPYNEITLRQTCKTQHDDEGCAWTWYNKDSKLTANEEYTLKIPMVVSDVESEFSFPMIGLGSREASTIEVYDINIEQINNSDLSFIFLGNKNNWGYKALNYGEEYILEFSANESSENYFLFKFADAIYDDWGAYYNESNVITCIGKDEKHKNKSSKITTKYFKDLNKDYVTNNTNTSVKASFYIDNDYYVVTDEYNAVPSTSALTYSYKGIVTGNGETIYMKFFLNSNYTWSTVGYTDSNYTTTTAVGTTNGTYTRSGNTISFKIFSRYDMTATTSDNWESIYIDGVYKGSLSKM
ncbi:MAG: hypothetical protein IJL70_00330 [Treponema sp.]|nr:hypothetical protein [Treponema sp.]